MRPTQLDRREAVWASTIAERPDGSASQAVLGIDNRSTGVPYPIAVRGAVKCITCDGFSEDLLVCPECRAIIQLLRSGPNLEGLQQLIRIATEYPGLVTALEQLTDEAVAEVYLAKIQQRRK